MKPDTLEAIECLKSWARSGLGNDPAIEKLIKDLTTVEDILDDEYFRPSSSYDVDDSSEDEYDVTFE